MSLIDIYYPEDEEKKKKLTPSQNVSLEQKAKKSLIDTYYPTKEKEIVEQPKKPSLGEKIKSAGKSVFEFGKELVTGFKAGTPQAIAAVKKTGSDILQRLAEGETMKAKAFPSLFKTEGEVGIALSKEAEKVKQSAIKDFKKSNILNAELPIVDQGSFLKNIKDPKWLGRNLGQSLPNLVASLGISTVTTALTANPAVGLVAGFGTSYSLESGFAYMDAIEAGVDEDTANKVSLVVGVGNGVLDSLPFGRLLTKIPGGATLKRAIIREIVGGIIKQTALEATTESLQEIVSNAVARVYDKDRSLFAGVPESFLIGGILGGGTSLVIETPLDLMQNRSAKVVDGLNEAVKNAEAKPEELRTQDEKDLLDANKGITNVKPIEIKTNKLETAIKQYKQDQGVNILPSGEMKINVPLQELTKLAETPEVKTMTAEQVAKLPKNKDGTISVWRVGTPREGERLVSATLTKETAETFKELHLDTFGKDRPITEYKVKPEDIKIVIGGAEQEVLIKNPVVKEVQEVGKKKTGALKTITEGREAGKVAKIPKELESLAQEARKSKNMSEFVATQIFDKSIPGTMKAIIDKNFKGKNFDDKLENFYNQVIKREQPQITAKTPLPSPTKKVSSVQAQKTTPLPPEFDLVKDALFSGDEAGAKAIYKDIQGEKPTFESIKTEIESYQESELLSVKNDLGETTSLPLDNPNRILSDIANRLGKHFKAPKSLFKITGRERTYTTPQGLKLTVGGDQKVALDNLIFNTDIVGFSKNIEVLAYKFDKTFSELSASIKSGDIDGANYDIFKKQFSNIIKTRPTYAKRPSEPIKVKPKITGEKPSPKITKPIPSKPSSSIEASKGVFAELENLTKQMEKNNLKVVEFPELVRISKELLGQVPKVTASKRGKYLGYFKGKGKGEILLKAEAFKNPDIASKLLAHEVGHLTDYIPEGNLKRGNLVGRIATLQRYLKKEFGELDNKVIRKELMDLSAKWRPVEKGKGTAEDLVGDTYRSSSKELYADAISVLFNDPVRLQQEAPEFYEGFFNYLDKKPEARKTFLDTWDLLNEGEEAVFNKRDEELSKSFEKGEEAFVAKELEKAKRGTSLMYQIRLLFDDKNIPILEKIKQVEKTKVIPDELNPNYALKGLNYYEGELKNYIADNFQPIFAKSQEVVDGWNKLGKILFYERVANERGELANPQGYNPSTAKDQLASMEKTISKEDWIKLQEAKELFRKAVQKSVDLSEKNGFYTKELLTQMKANPAYATYQVIDYIDTYLSARAYRSVGTLKDIANPATSTIMKLISVHKAIKRNNAKKVNIEFLKENFPESVEEAKTTWTGKGMSIQQPKDIEKGLVIAIEDGKPQGYYLEKGIADMLTYTPNQTLEAAAKVSRVLTQSKFYRPLFTSFNLGFQTFNFVRDFMRYWKNVPDYTLKSAILSFPRAIKRYGQAVKPSLSRALDNKNALIKEMENLNILGDTYNQSYKVEEKTEQQQIERVLERSGVLESTKRRNIFTPFVWVLEKVEQLGNFIETLPKVAGYIELKGNMPEKELANFIRTNVGSPDFRTGGTFTPISNNIFLFSNAIKEGIKSDMKIALTKNPSRAGFWWKTTVSTFVPKFIMMAVVAGLFGDELKKLMEGVSEYDKTNYTIIPLGETENGKPIYLRIPQDETGRFLGGLLWKTINITRDKDIIKSVFDVFSFGAGQFPNLSPSITGVGAIVQYLSGKNPYDSFRGRNVIPDTEFKAGMKYSLPIFLSWLAKNQGLGIFFPTYQPEYPSTLEKVLNAPFISNILGRWIKVSDYGEVEKLNKVSAGVEKERAGRLLEERKIIDDAIKEYTNNPSLTKKLELRRKIKEEIGGDKTKKTNTVKKFEIGILRGQQDQNLNSLIDANSNEEKVSLLLEIEKQLSKEEFEELYKLARKEKVISEDVIKEYRKAKR